MAGIALKGQCDFVSIMVPPEVSLKEKNVRQKKNVIKYIGTNFLSELIS